jgi:hypothetical protein
LSPVFTLSVLFDNIRLIKYYFMETTGDLSKPEVNPNTKEIKSIITPPNFEGKQFEITTSQEQLANCFGQFASEYAHLPTEEAKNFFINKVKFRFGPVKSISPENSILNNIVSKIENFRMSNTSGCVRPFKGEKIELIVDPQTIVDSFPELSQDEYLSSSLRQRAEAFKLSIKSILKHEFVHLTQKGQYEKKEITWFSREKERLKKLGITASIGTAAIGINHLAPDLLPATPQLVLLCLNIIGPAAAPTYAVYSAIRSMKLKEREAYSSMYFKTKSELIPFQYKIITPK